VKQIIVTHIVSRFMLEGNEPVCVKYGLQLHWDSLYCLHFDKFLPLVESKVKVKLSLCLTKHHAMNTYPVLH